MPDLALFQEAFAEALLAPDPEGTLARSPGFAVYRNTCALGVVEALRAAYPTVDTLLGEEAFAAAALDYRAERPPTGPVLCEYGSDFAGFLARQPWTSELPYLADVARLDRLWLESHLAAERAPSADVTPGRSLKLSLHPATRFAWLDTPATTIWLAHRVPGGLERLSLDWRPEGALFTRRRGAVAARPLERAEYRLLSALAAGATLEAAAAALDEAPDASDLPGLFARVIASGAVIPV